MVVALLLCHIIRGEWEEPALGRGFIFYMSKRTWLHSSFLKLGLTGRVPSRVPEYYVYALKALGLASRDRRW